MSTHVHTTGIDRNIGCNTLSECSCGARKWSHEKEITSESGTFRIEDGWYVHIPTESKEETARRKAYEMVQTEGYGYGEDTKDLFDSQVPNID